MQKPEAERNGSSEGDTDRAEEVRRHTGPGTGTGAGAGPISSHRTDGGCSTEGKENAEVAKLEKCLALRSHEDLAP
jgi:hypothetical protein